MGDKEAKVNFDNHAGRRMGCPAMLNPAVDFLVQFPQRFQNGLKLHFKHLVKNEWNFNSSKPLTLEKESSTALEVSMDKQMQAWKENSYWVDQPPEIKVSVPKDSLCNLHVKCKVGLPPDTIYDIVIDPENKRVFKNIKEVLSRRVLVDEGLRQVVDVEQAAIWRFLWLSGTISVHVIVDQNRKDHTVKFKQGKPGFMKRFEGCWKVEPLFVDERLCFPYKPKTWSDYESCTGGKGRVGSIVSLDQLIQPAIVPPPPFSWYLRGITVKTTEMLIHDLLAEAAKLRGAVSDVVLRQELKASYDDSLDGSACSADDIKERWRWRRNMRRHKKSQLFWCNK